MSRNNSFNIHSRELIDEENKYSEQAYQQAIQSEEYEEKWVGITDEDLTLQPVSMPPSPQSTQPEMPNLDVDFDFEFDIDNDEEENDIQEAG
jgi:hypothetical protein